LTLFLKQARLLFLIPRHDYPTRYSEDEEYREYKEDFMSTLENLVGLFVAYPIPSLFSITLFAGVLIIIGLCMYLSIKEWPEKYRKYLKRRRTKKMRPIEMAIKEMVETMGRPPFIINEVGGVTAICTRSDFETALEAFCATAEKETEAELGKVLVSVPLVCVFWDNLSSQRLIHCGERSEMRKILDSVVKKMTGGDLDPNDEEGNEIRSKFLFNSIYELWGFPHTKRDTTDLCDIDPRLLVPFSGNSPEKILKEQKETFGKKTLAEAEAYLLSGVPEFGKTEPEPEAVSESEK
jgi:hypothetical protein